MQIGIVGKPSSGKSTIFSAMTLVDVAIANYPFTTIEPNKGIGFVRIPCIDTDFNTQCNPRSGYCHNHIRFVPVELIDVAGLVPGASEGKGRGNAFLSDLSRADVLIHVIDASGSTNEKGDPVSPGSHDPVQDVAFLENEIGLWFFGILQKNWAKISKQPYESRQKMLEGFSRALSGLSLSEAQIERALTKTGLGEKKLNLWSDDDQKTFSFTLRENAKPIVIAANKIDISTAEKNVKRLQEQFPKIPVIPCSGFAELALKKAAKQGIIEYTPGEKSFAVKGELNEKQKQLLDLIKTSVLEKYGSTGVQNVLEKTVLEILGYIAVFPAGVHKLEDSNGKILPDCFLMPPHTTALAFAYKLHTTMGEGFIKAIDVKTKQMVGKEHELKHRDAIEIVFKG
ncbi:MAG: redox-regulated ATPase YchF [Candidatus Diapherotrites archaeon]|uniref:Redox-regulated ATPase YchF n=1 Tax=Candidatus Iainarchaeum sp. TaxID=3101447 RepID=A0A8T4LE30_9ARCH|nr:redox-regulated ATPase YchF [Candidatus Diapherotrites archaeon]